MLRGVVRFCQEDTALADSKNGKNGKNGPTKRRRIDCVGRVHGTLIDSDFSALCSGEIPVPVTKAKTRYEGYQRNRQTERLVGLQALARRLWPHKFQTSQLVRVHPFAWAAIEQLVQWRYRPLRGQVPVGELCCRLGTACDAVWWDTVRRRYLVVELKNSIHYAKHRQQYQRQLALTTWLFCRTFPHHVRAHGVNGMLLVVNTDGAKPYWLSEEALQWAKQCATRLAQEVRKPALRRNGPI